MLELTAIFFMIFSIAPLLYKLKTTRKRVEYLGDTLFVERKETQKLRLAQNHLIKRFFDRTAKLEQRNHELKEALASLNKTTAELEQFFEITPDLFCLADRTGRFHMVNPAFCELLGYTRAEMLASPILNFIHPDDHVATQNAINLACQGHEVKDAQNRYISKDGTIKILSWSAGSADGSSMTYAAARDITEQVLSQQKLKEQQDIIDAIVDTSPVGLGFYYDNKIVWANKTLLEIIGCPDMDHVTGTAIGFSENYGDGFSDLVNLVEIGNIGVVAIDASISRGDGTIAEVLVQGKLLDYRKPENGAIFTVTDITKRKKYELQLKGYQQRLGGLLKELTIAEERQRRSIAGELHDTISQDLALMRIRLQVLASQVGKEQRQEVQPIISQLDDVLKSTRDMTIQLSPPVLSQFGLDAAVDWLLKRVNAEEGFFIECCRQGKARRPDEDVETLLFRCFRELIINIQKHANANCVWVSLHFQPSGVEACVIDDGVGFDVHQLKCNCDQGFGLFSIGERLNAIGGGMHVDSDRQNGTAVKIWAPFTHRVNTMEDINEN